MSAIIEAQLTKSGKDTELGVRTGATLLTPEQLSASKHKFTTEQYNWMLISVWFGLRPQEVNDLKNNKFFKIEYDTNLKVHILHVYQSKLKKIAPYKRWKFIPAIFSEQVSCIDVIKSGKFERPLHKVIRKHLGQGYTWYSGRKGFTDLMLSKGQKLEDASSWMGHRSIERTWISYKDKQRISL